VALKFASNVAEMRKVFEKCSSIAVLSSWTKLAKSFVLQFPAQMKPMVLALMDSIQYSLISWRRVELIVGLATAFVSCGPEELAVGAALEWPSELVAYLVAWYKRAKAEDILQADFSAIFECLKHFVPVLDPEVTTDLELLIEWVCKSERHADAFWELFQMVCDVP
jgi:hypothetical protein